MADAKNSNTPSGTTPDPAIESTTGSDNPAIRFDEGASAKPGATQQLKDEASKLGTQAADRAREYAGQGKEKATNALDEVAKMFEGAALDVDARLGEEYGKYARSAAQGISSFADSLRGKEVDDLITDATELVKKSPVIAVGAAAAVGFVLARLIKSGVDAASETSDA
ncbi:hypothetical protein RZN05_06915 [Sphingomonas sp. HF-S4]|uniref:DUF883 domain-containing protein n=1 Tax=Sphingomonas agrestis TaxID=3080540 RepID=A0ABU3Y5R5_9SPHN|nr:hypothetical protein [Sphingomonas sp. HF-S4]MDV3456710.1 hypothetical protein [Sphingomonas sp. HF-S4]